MTQNKNKNNITVVIVIYREDYELLYKTLYEIKNFKIIIIDNSNNVRLKKRIEKEFIIEKYILNKKNLGFSSGYNQGIKLCSTEYVLILNPDCIIDEKSIFELHDKLIKNENCFLTTATSYDQNNKLSYVSGLLPENGEKNTILQVEGDVCVENVLGSCMFLKTIDFMNIGLFNEIFFNFFSDDDLCRKIKNRKKYIIQVYDAKCIHVHGISKVKNYFKKIYLREHFYLLDKFYYFHKSKSHITSINHERNKKNNYLIKLLVCLITFRLNKFIYYYAKYTAILKFNSYLKKD